MTPPLHERIRTDMQQRILSGALAPGDRVPTELELMAQYSCARMTVNKALSALVSAGLIERRKRAGSFVAAPRVHSMVLDVPDLMQEVVARGHAYEYRLLERTIERVRATRDDPFDVGPGRILKLSGLHLADGSPLAVEHRVVSIASVPAIEEARFESEPPGTWLLRHVPWTEAETQISAVNADLATAKLLAVTTGAALLVIKRRTARGDDRITAVRQAFRGNGYDLFARFNPESEWTDLRRR